MSGVSNSPEEGVSKPFYGCGRELPEMAPCRAGLECRVPMHLEAEWETGQALSFVVVVVVHVVVGCCCRFNC